MLNNDEMNFVWDTNSLYYLNLRNVAWIFEKIVAVCIQILIFLTVLKHLTILSISKID